ncbi:hypothetical protein EJD97_003238 [Solanum chilense]|uniref:Cystatin domain-containing protein n=1 Tax=Solanum chilense TaxID=4083 RepID=A0A6N2BUQ6_SOLCI|nr:hypothetical protein EJD97_003238 [Solanum chilense]
MNPPLPSCHPPAQAEELPFPVAEETDTPAPKKHKIGDQEDTANISDEEDGYTNPLFRTCADYDSEEENYCPDIPGAKMDKPLWEKYWKQIKESEGFDITDCPGGCWMTTIVPMQHILYTTENVDRLKGHAGKALEHYNNINGTSYEVDNILKVNGQAAGRFFAYYLTFSTKNGETHTFQAKVLEDLDDSTEVLIVRPKVATMG